MAACVSVGIRPAFGQPVFPSKPIKLVVPFAAAGGADAVARQLALAKALRTPWLIENKPGAAGAIGLEMVARSAPDGHTLALTAGSTLTISPHVTPAAVFEPWRELRAVAQVGVTSLVLVVKADHPARRLQAFVEMTKARPRSTSFGSYGVGTLGHLIGEALNQATGCDMLHVPFGGAAPAINALLGGQITAVIADTGSLRGFLDPQGRLRALAATGSHRLPVLDGVPTFGEEGLPQLDAMDGWLGLFAPVKTPDEVVQNLARATHEALREEGLRSSLVALGYAPTGTAGTVFEALIIAETQRWEAVIRTMGGLRRD